MVKRAVMLLFLVAMLPAGCHGNQDAMQASLDTIRGLLKQSAAMAGQAACMPGGKGRSDMVHAAVTLARQAMGGPEMMKIHKMMNMQPGESGTAMAVKADAGQGMAARMKEHVVLHDTGEGIFDFLDVVSGQQPLTCKQAEAVALAATAALLRETPGVKTDEAARKLDKAADMRLRQAGVSVVKIVANLVRTLQKI